MMSNPDKEVLILGCGYAGRRVAQRLREQGVRVTATSRDPSHQARLDAAGVKLIRFDVTESGSFDALRREVEPGVVVLHSLPVVEGAAGPSDPTPAVLDLLGDRPSRIVYLSTTGVYGETREVDETTPVAPVTERQRLRVAAEKAVLGRPWTALVLRAAAIYGPGRGVHVRLREGRFKLLGDGSNFISRIHVDDLANIVTAALLSNVAGAYPVADDEPCPSREIVAFCSELLGLPMPPAAGPEDLDETRRSDRRVDGRAIRRLLGVELSYPSYRVGVPAAMETTADNW